MIIRLAPDLVEEIKRVEAQGGRARMKFDPNPNHSGGNVSFLVKLSSMPYFGVLILMGFSHKFTFFKKLFFFECFQMNIAVYLIYSVISSVSKLFGKF